MFGEMTNSLALSEKNKWCTLFVKVTFWVFLYSINISCILLKMLMLLKKMTKMTSMIKKNLNDNEILMNTRMIIKEVKAIVTTEVNLPMEKNTFSCQFGFT